MAMRERRLPRPALPASRRLAIAAGAGLLVCGGALLVLNRAVGMAWSLVVCGAALLLMPTEP